MEHNKILPYQDKLTLWNEGIIRLDSLMNNDFEIVDGNNAEWPCVLFEIPENIYTQLRKWLILHCRYALHEC